MMLIFAALLIPLIVFVLLFFSAADDFWQIITFRINLSRLFDDLIHVLAIIGIGVLAELFVIFMLIKHML